MAVIVETGAGVANSNSYVSRADYIAYAATFGVTIADDTAADFQLVKAAQFIDEHEANMKGWRVARDQSMAFPRSGVVIEEWAWDSDEIPRQLELCQMSYALDINSGYDLWNRQVNPNLITTAERVEGAVSVQYAVNGGNTGQKATYTSKGDAFLAMLLKRNGLMSVQMVRA